MHPEQMLAVSEGRRRKFNGRLIWVAIAAGALGFALHPAVVAVRDLSCNAECKAQLLYKNPIFFELRQALSNNQISSESVTEGVHSRYTKEYLGQKGLASYYILGHGRFILGSRFDGLIMVATLKQDPDGLTWNCDFFGGGDESPPKSRRCSY
jgi:hypothetical protein